MQMLVLMRLTVTVIESHFLLVRLSPTQLTVPFDSSLLEGAFAGVNILFQTHIINTFQRNDKTKSFKENDTIQEEVDVLSAHIEDNFQRRNVQFSPPLKSTKSTFFP